MTKTKIGLIEEIRLFGANKQAKTLGKFDTGARRTSIDKDLAKKLGLTKKGKIKVGNVHGHSIRELAKVTLQIKDKKIKTTANISNRKNRKYKVLLGRDVIFGNFMIDPSLSHKSPELGDLK